MQTLYVLFSLPSQAVPKNAKILSFLPPSDEMKGLSYLELDLFIASEEMDCIREKARQFYINLVARVGATPCDGVTLRSVLAETKEKTSWWYHPFTAKSNEVDPAFNQILQIFAIISVAKREQATKLILYACDDQVASVLSSQFEVLSHAVTHQKTLSLFRGLLARIKFLGVQAKNLYKISRYTGSLPQKKFDIIFQGFWDWSVSKDSRGELSDKYFCQLPQQFSSPNEKYGWFLWYSDDEATAKGKKSKAILSSALGVDKLVFIQKFLTLGDLLFTFFDFRPLFRYLSFQRKKSFKVLFVENGLDYFPLFQDSLPYYFCNSTIPLHQLAEVAYCKAFQEYTPKIGVTFQELFLWPRAFYQGARKAIPNILLSTVQHASYNREKTFAVIDPKMEYKGEPDNLAFPLPQYVFAMGALGRQIFLENGFPPDHVFPTGSPRYSHVSQCPSQVRNPSSCEKIVNLLLAPTLNRKLEFHMVVAAILASENLKEVRITLRSHPHGRMEDWPPLKPYLSKVHSSTATLVEDLEEADIILFSYSTVAEEALLLGKPVWKWEFPGFNGSVFREIPVVPRFHTVIQLKNELEAYIQNPSAYLPDQKVQEQVLQQCFYDTEGRSSEKIAKILKAHIAQETARLCQK